MSIQNTSDRMDFGRHVRYYHHPDFYYHFNRSNLVIQNAERRASLDIFVPNGTLEFEPLDINNVYVHFYSGDIENFDHVEMEQLRSSGSPIIATQAGLDIMSRVDFDYIYHYHMSGLDFAVGNDLLVPCIDEDNYLITVFQFYDNQGDVIGIKIIIALE